MPVFCGIDWAEDHHDVALVDEAGTLLARQRIPDDADGYQHLLELLAHRGDDAEHPIPIAIETPRGLLVACLRAAGRPIYPINPLAVPSEPRRSPSWRAHTRTPSGIGSR